MNIITSDKKRVYRFDSNKFRKLNIDEQASVTVGRYTNEDFIRFKNTYMNSIQALREIIRSISNVKMIDTEQLLYITETLFTRAKSKLDAILYLSAISPKEDLVIEHCMRVSLLANVFAEWLELDEALVKDATVAGLLHDIGMLEVPREIIESKNELDPGQQSIIREHIGRTMILLLNKGINNNIMDAVRQHHECNDGSGYPKGRKGLEIAYFASLISIVDMYDSMLTHQLRNGVICPFSVIDELEKELSVKFRMDMLKVFVDNIPYVYSDAIVRLSNNCTANVMYINKSSKAAPIVKLETSGKVIDLSTRSDLKITALL